MSVGTSFLEDPLLINTNQHPELKENDDHHRIVEIVQEIPIIHTDEPSLVKLKYTITL